MEPNKNANILLQPFFRSKYKQPLSKYFVRLAQKRPLLPTQIREFFFVFFCGCFKGRGGKFTAQNFYIFIDDTGPRWYDLSGVSPTGFLKPSFEALSRFCNDFRTQIHIYNFYYKYFLKEAKKFVLIH